MAEFWYYTIEGKQMDPVTAAELQSLIGAGTVKATDMVWKEGLPRWIRAGSVKELFAEAGPAIDAQFSRTKGPENVGPAPAPVGSSAVKPASAAPSTAEEEPRLARRRRPLDDSTAPGLPGAKSSASSGGILAALVVGALLLVAGLGVGVAILILANQTAKDGKINVDNLVKSEVKYNLVLAPRARDSRRFSFRKGVDYQFDVSTKPQAGGVDVDLHIFNAQGTEVRFDNGPQPDCHLEWTPDHDGEYRVDVINIVNPGFEPGEQVNCVVVIKEIKAAPIVDKKDPAKEPSLPADALEGRGFKSDFKSLKKEDVQKFRVKAGHEATFKFVPTNPKANYNIIVVKDSDTNQMIAQDVGPEANAQVRFTLKMTEIVQVHIINASGKGAGAGAVKGTLSYDASP